jgi:4'-phosphopantetheinyl transferase
VPTVSFHPGPPPPGACHVWWGRPGALARGAGGLLDVVERQRLAALRRPADRDRFAAACAVARLALAAYLDRRPDAVALDRTCSTCGRPHGKPRLAGPAPAPLELSVSHAGARVAVAFTVGAPVGVDVEVLRPDLPVGELAPQVLSADELRALDRLAAAARPRFLLERWTRKEAILKALGVGLAVPPAGVDVSAPAPPLTLRELHPGPGHLASLAVVGDCRRVVELDGSGLFEGPPVVWRAWPDGV